MEPISNVDRLVLLLRQKLQTRERTRSTKADAARSAKAGKGGVTAAQALAAMDSADDRQLRRALIQGLLSDQFGEDMLNAPRFQQVVDRVTAAIEGDEAGRALLDRMTAELRGTRP